MSDVTLSQRHEFIESQIEAAQRTLEHPRAVELLGANVVASLLEITSRLFVPNYDGKGIEFPQADLDSNAIPVVAMYEGDYFFNDNKDAIALAPIQRENVDFYLAAKGLRPKARQRKINEVNNRLRATLAHYPYSFEKPGGEYGEIGFSVRKRVPIRVGLHQVEVMGRPAILLNGMLSMPPEYTGPNLIHEEAHISQILDHPITPFGPLGPNYDTRESAELEAYYIQHRAELIEEITEETLAKKIHDTVETHRSTNDHPFAPNDAIRKDVSSISFSFEA